MNYIDFDLDTKKLDYSDINNYSFLEIDQFLKKTVLKGDVQSVKRDLDFTIIDRMGKIASKESKQSEYSVIVVITKAVSMVVDEGISVTEVCEVSDFYLQKLENCQNDIDRAEILIKCLEKFAKMIESFQNDKCDSMYVNKAKRYIRRNLKRKFKLDDIAGDVGINSSYLCRIFKHYTNITMGEFIKREKISAAQNILKYSEASITEIAQYFNFSSQSYFSKIFKEYCEMKPAEYRRKYKTEDFISSNDLLINKKEVNIFH